MYIYPPITASHAQHVAAFPEYEGDNVQRTPSQTEQQPNRPNNHAYSSVDGTHQILNALLRCCQEGTDQTIGVSTRQIADMTGMSIYKTRHLLLKLKKSRDVLANKTAQNKHTRWRIVG